MTNWHEARAVSVAELMLVAFVGFVGGAFNSQIVFDASKNNWSAVAIDWAAFAIFAAFAWAMMRRLRNLRLNQADMESKIDAAFEDAAQRIEGGDE